MTNKKPHQTPFNSTLRLFRMTCGALWRQVRLWKW